MQLEALGPGPRQIGGPLIRDRYSAFRFDGPARSLLHAYKFRGGGLLARQIAALMAPDLPAWFAGATIVPVPTSRARVRSRGFDQAVQIGQHLGVETGRPVVEMVGRNPGRPQTAASRSQRLGLADDTFFAQSAANFRRTSVVLLDDVCTTGVTLDKCASVIKGRANAIYAVTFAATVRRT